VQKEILLPLSLAAHQKELPQLY
jgi:hypothetical protein